MREEFSTELGHIRIYSSVVKQIVNTSIQKNPYIKRLHFSSGLKILRFFRPSTLLPIKVVMAKDKIKVKVPVIVYYEENISEIAGKIQEEIATKLQEHIDSVNFEIDVDIRGIEGR